MYEFAETGQLLPILVGTLMADLAGSGKMVPILGVEKNPETGRLMPLGGTMEDPDGDGECLVVMATLFYFHRCRFWFIRVM